MKRLLLLAPMMWMVSAQAQTQIKPGSAELRSDLVTSSHNFYKAFATDSLGHVQYEWVNDQVVIVDKVKGTIMFTRSRQVPVGAFQADTSVTDLSLKPVSMHEMHYKQGVKFEMNFADTLATVYKFRHDSATGTKAFPLGAGYFEDNMIESVYAYLDLQKGVTYQMQNFNKDVPHGFSWVTVEYSFDDILVSSTGGHIDCRVIHYVNGKYSGYVWVEKDTRTVIREIGGDGKGMMYSLNRV